MPENDARPVIPVPADAGGDPGILDQPEIIFETGHAVQVIPTALKWCMAPTSARPPTGRTRPTGGAGAFVAFQGEAVRERILYIGHELLAFTDPVTRTNATLTLHFERDPDVHPSGDWALKWSSSDGEKKQWVTLAEAGAEVADATERLTRSGDISITRLPEVAETEVNGDKDRWLACRLEPVREAVTLPRIREITISRRIDVAESKVDPLVLTVSQAGAAFAEVKPEDGFYPFGLYPSLLDGLYIQANEAFTKPGATIELEFRGDGLPTEIEDTSVLETLNVVWEYFSAEGWTPLGASRWGCPDMAFVDRTPTATPAPTIRWSKVSACARRPSAAGSRSNCRSITRAQSRPPASRRAGWSCRVASRSSSPTCPRRRRFAGPIIERGRSYTSAPEFQRRHLRIHCQVLSEDAAAGAADRAAGKNPGIVAFTVPAPGGSHPAFAETEINGQTGYSSGVHRKGRLQRAADPQTRPAAEAVSRQAPAAAAQGDPAPGAQLRGPIRGLPPHGRSSPCAALRGED